MTSFDPNKNTTGYNVPGFSAASSTFNKVSSPKEASKTPLPLEKHPLKLMQFDQAVSDQNLQGKNIHEKTKKTMETKPEIDAPPAVHPLNLTKRETFLGKYTQISVLNQMADQTSYGIENCGFHALKNALAMLAALSNYKEIPIILSNPQVFLKFYTTYCAPLLENRQASGQRDASIPMLRELIRNIQNDLNPPKELVFMKEVLKDSEKKLAIISTSTMIEGGLKGFIENEGVLDAKNFYEFAKGQTGRDFVIIFGNEDEGHWITIDVSRDENGNLHYFGCDSMVNNHARQEELSQFVKVANAIESGIAHPEATMLNALVDPCENLVIKAGWIGTPSEELLLDDTPNLLMSKDENSKGSNKEILLEQIFIIYETMHDLDLVDSSDMEIQIYLSNILSLTEFFSQKLGNDPLAVKCKNIAEEIKQSRGDAYFKVQLLKACDQLNEIVKTVPDSDRQTFSKTIELVNWIIELDNAKEKITHNTQYKEEMRAKYSIEHEFSKNPIQDIERNMVVFLQGFQLATKLGKLKEFCQVVGTPSCFTGRMAGVEDYIPRLKWPEMDALALSGYLYMLSDVVISETIANLTSYDENLMRSFSIEELNNPGAKAILVQLFRLYAAASTAKPFLEFLQKEGMTKTQIVDEINFEEVVIKLIASKYFNEMFSRGKAEVIRQFG